MMVVTVGPELEVALKKAAGQRGVSPETLALNALHERFLGRPPNSVGKLIKH
jgi:hypothetical protein